MFHDFKSTVSKSSSAISIYHHSARKGTRQVYVKGFTSSLACKSAAACDDGEDLGIVKVSGGSEHEWDHDHKSTVNEEFFRVWCLSSFARAERVRYMWRDLLPFWHPNQQSSSVSRRNWGEIERCRARQNFGMGLSTATRPYSQP